VDEACWEDVAHVDNYIEKTFESRVDGFSILDLEIVDWYYRLQDDY